ncbi:uncharacterized protein [Hoplias malabaricus]|uniref:uncharacterized protein n=1 Tax=Hoplias malabaricus TaxID=27720 RepID=UPI003461FB1D
MTDQTRSSSVSEGRLRMYSNAEGRFVFLIRDLTPQDSGFYRFTVGKKKSEKDIRLSVITDSEKEQHGRFSIFDDRKSKVFRVELSDVRKQDGVVYSCGAKKTIKFVTYYSYFREFQLQVTETTTESPSTTTHITAATYMITSTPTETTSDEEYGFSSVVVYPSLGASVFLLALAMITAVYCKIKSKAPETMTRSSIDIKEYKTIDLTPTPLQSNTNQSDSVYQSLNSNTNQSDSVYQSLNPKTNQSDSVYQSLNPNTNQSDSVYHSLNSAPITTLSPLCTCTLTQSHFLPLTTPTVL